MNTVKQKTSFLTGTSIKRPNGQSKVTAAFPGGHLLKVGLIKWYWFSGCFRMLFLNLIVSFGRFGITSFHCHDSKVVYRLVSKLVSKVRFLNLCAAWCFWLATFRYPSDLFCERRAAGSMSSANQRNTNVLLNCQKPGNSNSWLTEQRFPLFLLLNVRINLNKTINYVIIKTHLTGNWNILLRVTLISICMW